VLTHSGGVLYLSVPAAQQEPPHARLVRGQMTSRPPNSEVASACRGWRLYGALQFQRTHASLDMPRQAFSIFNAPEAADKSSS